MYMKKIAYFSLALALTACGGKTQMPEQSNDFTVELSLIHISEPTRLL